MLLNSGGVYVSGWTFPNRCDHPGCNPHTKSYKGTVRSPHKKQRVNKPTPQQKKQQVEKEKVTFYGWFLVGFLNWTCILPKPTLWYIIVLRCSWVFIGITIGFTEFEANLHVLHPKNPDPFLWETPDPPFMTILGPKKTGGNLTPKNDSWRILS